ncbi:nucleotide sugar dehydrogenase [Streptomyces sp. SID5477]|nr:nucleotide sugar dehydrogenase [Streptomyces sp. SID5477]
MPLVQAAVRAGLSVTGFDTSEHVVRGIRGGTSHVDDLSDADIGELLADGLHVTCDPEALARASTVLICVPTPLSETGGPDLTAVTSATTTVAEQLRPGTTVVLESTTYPGTTEEVVRPLLEKSGLTAGEDFHLAFSPERVDPGNPTWGIVNTPKVVGGLTPACTDAAVAFYTRFVDTVHRASSPKEAEMAKLLENTYRHVNIALVNEMAVFCNELGIDLWETIGLAKTKPFGYQAFYPGPGVGGHCIPIDPNYLSYRVRTLGYPFRFVDLAGEINNRMPEYVTARATAVLNRDRRSIAGSRVVLLGVTYKPDVADERESPAAAVARRVVAAGAELAYHDPYINNWSILGRPVERVENLAESSADLYILLTHHRQYVEGQIDGLTPLLDTRGAISHRDGVERL